VFKEHQFDLFFEEFSKAKDADGDGSYNLNDLTEIFFDTRFQEEGVLGPLIHAALTNQNPFSSMMVLDQQKVGVRITNDRTHIEIIDRKSGVKVQEKIPSYVAMALRMAYNTKIGRTIGWAGTKALWAMSVREGQKRDSPDSRKEIHEFAAFHNINLEEIDRDIEEYENFNDFFARALKPGARVIASEGDPLVAVSPADCRALVFNDILDATKFWIKGSNFTLKGCLGTAWENGLDEVFAEGASLLISRLSPQDYHRWHIPVTGKCTKITPIEGVLYSVNPIVVNQNVDVFTENKRCIVEYDTEGFGKVVMVVVAATLVGSYQLFKEVGNDCVKGDLHGEFRFGGSTVLTLFPKGSIKFSQDLVTNSAVPIETLCKVGEAVGSSENVHAQG